MKRTFTTLTVIAGLMAGTASAAPISGSGWNQDMVAESTATNSAVGITAATTSAAWSSWVLAEDGFAGATSGVPLPSGGAFTSESGTDFQIASYTGNNTIVDTHNNDAITTVDGTFTLDTPGSYSDLQFFISGIGDSSANASTQPDGFTAVLNFSDSSSSSYSTYVRDWQSEDPVGDGLTNAFDDKSSIVRRSNGSAFAVWTREYSVDLSVADQAKTIESIDFILLDRLGVSAVSGTLVPEPSSLALLGLGGLLIARRRRG